VSAPARTEAIDALDVGPADRFVAAMAPLFEGAPRFLDRLAAERPFGTDTRLFERARAIAHAMPEPEQVELIEAHPRLGAPPASVSAASYVEQGYDRDAAEEAAGRAAQDRERIAAELDRLNAAYEARFGFRYCVFVAGRSRAELLAEMAVALTEARDAEIHRALDAVVDIARDRYRRAHASD